MLLLCIGQSIKLTWLASISTPSPPSPHYSLGPGSAVREKGTRSNRKNIGEPSEPSHKLGRERAAATLSPPQLMAQFSLSSTLSSLQMIPRAKSERLGVKLLDHRLKVIITTKSYCLFTQCFFRLSLDWGISYPCSSLGIVDFLKLIWRMSENFKSGDKMKTKRDGEQWNNKIECSFREKFA